MIVTLWSTVIVKVGDAVKLPRIRKMRMAEGTSASAGRLNVQPLNAGCCPLVYANRIAAGQRGVGAERPGRSFAGQAIPCDGSCVVVLVPGWVMFVLSFTLGSR